MISIGLILAQDDGFDGGQLVYVIAIIVLSLAGWLADKFKQKMSDGSGKSSPLPRPRLPEEDIDNEVERPRVPPVVRRQPPVQPTARPVLPPRPVPPPPGSRPRPPSRSPAPPPARPRPALDRYETVYEAPKPSSSRPVPTPRPRPKAVPQPDPAAMERARLSEVEAERRRKEAERRLRDQQTSEFTTLGTIVAASTTAGTGKPALAAVSADQPALQPTMEELRRAVILSEIFQPPLALRNTSGGDSWA